MTQQRRVRHTAGSGPRAKPSVPRQRWLARFALLSAAAVPVVLVAFAGIGTIGLALVAVGGAVVCLAAVWWFLTHRGPLRWLAAVLAVAAPVAGAVLYRRAERWWVVAICGALWWAADAAGRAALAPAGQAGSPALSAAPRARRPFLIMNPRSGGGKVARFDLERKASALGAEVALLGGPGTGDVRELARRAIADGADLLGVAGGDGTQALVAGVAADHNIPFLVISAGTRNHFAMDLGLDREDPSTCLEAITDGVELRIDLGQVGDRIFVNNASFGAYAAVVRSPAYRDDKVRTTLDLLPELLTRHAGPRLRVRAGDVVLDGPQAVLVSNNPYAANDIAGLGRRDRLDSGMLGVVAVTIDRAAQAAGLVRGRRSKALRLATAAEVVVAADTPSVAVGIDGEAVSMPAPVHCRIMPGALRVRVPRHRPGLRGPRPTMDWDRLRRLALPAGWQRRATRS